MDQGVPSQFMREKDERNFETRFSVFSKRGSTSQSGRCEGCGWSMHDLDS